MTTTTLSFWCYTLGILAVGVYSARFGQRSSSDFFLADRGLGAWVAGLSVSASAESGWVTLGLVGMAFQTGVAALWIIPGIVLAFLFNWLVIADRLRVFAGKYQAITLPDVLAASFQGTVAILIRLFAVIILLVMLTAYVAAQFNATGKMFESMLAWQYVSGVLGGASITLIYTVSGGLRAVAWTDVVQALLMVSAVVILPLVLLLDLGGFEQLWQRLQALESAPHLTEPFAGKVGFGLVGFLSVWLGVSLGYPGQPHILVRFMATRDRTAVRRGAVISTLWVFVLFTGAVLLGITARAVYGTLPDPETALLTVAMDFLPGAMAGLMIAAVLAAICSTADSQLLVTAAAVSHDLYVRLFGRHPSTRSIVLFNRLAVLTIGIFAILIAAGEVRVIFDFVLYAWAGLGAAFGPALILILLWRRTTAAGVLAGMCVGFITAIVWREMLHEWLYELVPAFALAFITVVLVSWMFPEHGNAGISNKQDRLQ